MKRKEIIFFFLLICAFNAWGISYTVESIPNPQTTDTNSFVSNPDDILLPSTVSELNHQIALLRAQKGTEMAVVAIESIGFEEPDDFANRLYNHWKIGKEKVNNGVLVLLVNDAKTIVIRSGLGVEGILPDAIAKRIISQTIIPAFREGDFDGGILAGVNRIIQVVEQENFDYSTTKKEINWKEAVPYAIAIYLIILTLLFFWINKVVVQAKNNQSLTTNLSRYKVIKEQNSAAYSIVGFFLPIVSFFVILFALPFAFVLFLFPLPFVALPTYFYGKREMKKVRQAPIKCNECGNSMSFLSEEREDKYLALSQQFEEKLKSVDYDVFVCDTCQNEAIFALDIFSAYSKCPKCDTKAYILKKKKTIISPTYFSSGVLRSSYHCKFCGYEEDKDTKIPRLQRTNSSIAGGAAGGTIFSGRGGFGRGGSFGGGMTGGGGASGRW